LNSRKLKTHILKNW